MPVALGLHTQIHTQEDLTNLIEQANSENKRAIVVLGATGKVVKVLNKQNAFFEFLRRISGQTGREQARLGEFLSTLAPRPRADSGQGRVAGALYDAIHPDSSPKAERGEESTPTPAPSTAASTTSAPKTDSKSENPDLYADDPPFGTGGIVKGYYVQRQIGNCCLSHALSSYYGDKVFQTRDEYLSYRNTFYDRPEFSQATPQELALAKNDELSDTEAVIHVVDKIQVDPTRNHLVRSQAPWAYTLFRTPAPKLAPLPAGAPPGQKRQAIPINPADQQVWKQKIDGGFEYLAKLSDSKRFIVRTGGGGAGHFQTLVYEPHRDPNAPWTLLNSTRNYDTGLPNVTFGKSPSELLGNVHTTSGLALAVWTQSVADEARLDNIQVDHWNVPTISDERLQAIHQQEARPAANNPVANPQENHLPAIQEEKEGEDSDDDLPPPIIPPSQAAIDDDLPPPIFPVKPPAQQTPVASASAPQKIPLGDPWSFVKDPNLRKSLEELDADLTRQLAETQAPEIQQTFNELQTLVDVAKKRPDQQYRDLYNSIYQRVQELGLYDEPTAAEVATLKSDLRQLDQIQKSWAKLDSDLDIVSVKAQRAINDQIKNGQLTEAQVPDRSGYGGLLRSQRASFAELVKTRGQKPDGWTNQFYEGVLDTWNKAQRVGVADAAILPQWRGSAQEANHAAFINQSTRLIDNTIVAPEAQELPTPKPPTLDSLTPLARAGIPQASPPAIRTREELFNFIKLLSPHSDRNLIHYGGTQELAQRANNSQQDRLFSYQGIVFRGDSRLPAQINRAGGFTSRKDLTVPANQLESQGLGDGKGATGQSGVSTAKEFWGSATYMQYGRQPEGHIYLIDTRLIPQNEAAYDLLPIVRDNGYPVKDVGAEVNVTRAPFNAVIGWITVPNAAEILDDPSVSPAVRVLDELTIDQVGLNPQYVPPSNN